ncbi:MAG TPA: hypothetical protein VFA93_02630 [Patescibacteria group bacterium]|nr:hypothetical protein [Patescibacteria group bacterium]
MDEQKKIPQNPPQNVISVVRERSVGDHETDPLPNIEGLEPFVKIEDKPPVEKSSFEVKASAEKTPIPSEPSQGILSQIPSDEVAQAHLTLKTTKKDPLSADRAKAIIVIRESDKEKIAELEKKVEQLKAA